MAHLIPDKISQKAPEGERLFHLFLKRAFMARKDVVAWHSADPSDREIDFSVLVPGKGLFVVEVKDWALDQIRGEQGGKIELQIGPRTQSKTDPYRQAKECADRMRDAMRRDPALVHPPGGRHAGQPLIPVEHFVFFANIGRDEAMSSPQKPLFREERTLFKEDVDEGGKFLSARDPAGALTAFLGMQTKYNAPSIPPPMMEALKRTVFREWRVEIGAGGDGQTPGAPSPAAPPARRHGEMVLDNLQEQYARVIPDAPRILTGLPGSGKTVVLVHRAAFKAMRDDPTPRVLLTCYNLSLANAIRETVHSLLPAEARGRVSVVPFYDLCGEILGEKVPDKGDAAFFAGVSARALDAAMAMADERKFDSVLVDEGQDFDGTMARVALSMLKAGSRDALIALDRSQDIYRRVEGNAEFRSIAESRLPDLPVLTLPSAYRCTQQIFDFAHKVAGRPTPPPFDPETETFVRFPQHEGRVGPAPEVKTYERVDSLIDDLFNRIDRLIKADGVPPGEIAILYTSRHAPSSGPTDLDIPTRIRGDLATAGIPTTWVSEDGKSKRAFSLSHPSVKICTIHSAKGLDFEAVFLVDTSGLPVDKIASGRVAASSLSPESADALDLLFVGCTRARNRLVVMGAG